MEKREEMKGQCSKHVLNGVAGGSEQTVAWRACVFCSIGSGKPLKVFEEGHDML